VRGRAALIANYTGANAFYTLFSWLPSYFAETYTTEARGWVFNVVPYIAISVSSVTAPYVAVRMINRGYSVTATRKTMEVYTACTHSFINLQCASLLGVAVCLFAVTQVHAYTSAVFLLSLAMGARGLHHAGVSVIAQDMAPDHTGAVFGLINTSSAVPGFVGVYIAGYLLQVR
jgi:ACS family sodium-dependent inorganic phosphate cotransporter-like MFS transporter 9